MYKLKSRVRDFHALHPAYPFTKSNTIMAAKTKLAVVQELPQSTEVTEVLENQTPSLDATENLTLEQIIADELFDSIDWKAVNKALLASVKRRFISWFVGEKASSMIATNEIEAMAIAPAQDDEVAA